MGRLFRAYAQWPRLVQVGCGLFIAGALLDLVAHTPPLHGTLIVHHGLGGIEEFGHLVTLIGMVVIMLGIFHQRFSIHGRARPSVRHERRQSSDQ